MTGIIDYGLGNLFSIEKAFNRIQKPYLISNDPAKLRNCTRYILSGVGHYRYGMQQLDALGLIPCIQEEVLDKKKAILGICLGMQLMGSHSEEGNVEGLNLIPDTVTKMQVESPFKIPHIGWNTLNVLKKCDLLNQVDPANSFYFTHSYAFQTPSENSAANTEYGGIRFTSVINHKHISGVQFHPEKSYEQGLLILQNFCK